MLDNNSTLRLQSCHSLRTPQSLLSELVLPYQLHEAIAAARSTINNIMRGTDKRLLVVVGPCSIHDPLAAMEYAELIKKAMNHFSDALYLVMRSYFEKPRTMGGWKGLISDPFLDGSCDINSGLYLARKFLLDLAVKGIPAGTEFLDVFTPHFLSDLTAWVAIGARTSASQLHRELASGLPIPVGFKNNTNGNIKIAIDAVSVAAQPHHYIGINQHGQSTIIHTKGNNKCHIILRGSEEYTNYGASKVIAAAKKLQESQLIPRLIIDCSHGNSKKNYQNQRIVAHAIAKQLQSGSQVISGVMLESNLVSGKQYLNQNKPLLYGQSITDGCLSWEETWPLLEELARSILQRNKITSR